MDDKKVGSVVLMIPKDVCELDKVIMEHIAKEVKGVMCDGMCDLVEYGDGFEYEAEVTVLFKKVEVKNNGR